ncbi:TonB-dependent receptor [Sphingobacteruim zhuxiongii]|uniref:TonB-dependent receptor n=1 Tax=Sphingobacterium zhuxiongii TaxID=2662364 RepID=UPI001E42AD24|nr:MULTISPECIES: TonB-dependent receptor [unclassified Sphingobacterium]
MLLYTLGQNQNNSAVYRSNLGNIDLTWEGSQSSSFALEGRLLGRMNFTFEYFDKRSKDLLFKLNVPLSTGSTFTNGSAYINKNIGELVNRGFEFAVDVDVLKNKDFRWNLGLNGTIIKNKIINLPEQNREKGIISSPFKYLEGHSVYDYYLRQFVGVDMMTGQSLYQADIDTYDPNDASGAWFKFQQEINGVTYTRNASYAKEEFSGSGIPKLMGGINTSFDYKNWSLSALFTYSIGGKAIDYSYNSLMSFSSSSAVHVDIRNSWNGVPNGMTESSIDRINPNAIPQINFTNSQYNNALSSRFLMNSSYFTVKNITLGYRLPKLLLERYGLDQVGLIVSGENLHTFSKLKGYSPQQSFGGFSQNQFVPARTISFGINVGF